MITDMHSGHDHNQGFQRIEAPETPAEIAAFVAAVMAEPEEAMGHGHGDAGMMAEHQATLDLVPRGEATHVAVAHGSWFDPNTWADGSVPDAGARVLIPGGIEVTYDQVSEVPLFTVRVDGHLTFATDADTLLRVDTLVASAEGHLTIGSAADPVQDGVSAEILFVNSGDIDTAWDPLLLSRGLIAMGTTSMHGSVTDSHAKVSSDPLAGDTAIMFDALPEGWAVGDQLVIAGTRFDGHKWDNDIRAVRWHETQDEVRTITAIEESEAGVTLHFADPLLYDHDTPRDDLKTSVANLSRDIHLGTEDPDEAAIHQRGHVMFMHSDEVDIRYVAFDELGRTDKSERAVDAGDLTTVTPDANVKGRYVVHFHRSGVEDLDQPAIAVGNAVNGSPGWGFAHHDSNAILHNNATFNTFGAGYVAETGNEIGAWTDNIAIGAQGLNRIVKESSDVSAFDLARTGDGFWFQGRMVESSGNIAASVNHGFVYMHRGPGMLTFDAGIHDFPELFNGDSTVGPDDAPILEFRNNEAFAAKEGLHVVKANPNQGHDLHSHFTDFTAWEVKRGAHFEYTSHYTIEGFDLIGKTPSAFNLSDTGISFGPNTTDMTIVSGSIADFDTAGIDLQKVFTDPANSPDLHAFHVVDVAFGPGQTPFENYDPELDTVLDSPMEERSPFLVLDGPLTYREGYPDPGARKVEVTGTKYDSLGATPFPAGTDSVTLDRAEVIHILETEGYYSTPDGTLVFIIEVLISDRMTGEIVKEGHLVELNENVPLGNPFFGYADALYAGEIDPDSLAPVALDDSGMTMAGHDLVLDLLENDQDPDGDLLRVDGIVQPHHGEVFANEEGTVTYRPDIGFVGQDSFSYWASDGQGNFTRASAEVQVMAEEPEETRPVLEFGTLQLNHDAVTVQLQGSYENPVVIASLRTTEGSHPVAVRLDAVAEDSVTLRLLEPAYLDGRHATETVDFMVVEAGSWELADGTRLSAGITTVEGLDRNAAVAIETGLPQSDAIFAQQQESAAEFWTATRLQETTTGWETFLQVAEAREEELAAQPLSESIGWVALDASETPSGLFAMGQETGVTHDGAAVDVSAGLDGSASLAGVVHGLSSRFGGDPAASRGLGLDQSQLEIFVEEETSADSETRHIAEEVSWLAFSESALQELHEGFAF
ncbi:MAG: cadherin-like domain-containing protein [Pseudomonadota bacterium]